MTDSNFNPNPFKYTNSGRYKEGGITFVVNNLGGIIIFTLYGPRVDDTIGESIGFRAINQKEMSDYTTETVFNILFNNEVYVRYNVYVPLNEEELSNRLEQLMGQRRGGKRLIRDYRKNKNGIIRAEIDGEIIFSGIEGKGDFVEVKLYTCPGNKELNVLKKHMDDTSLLNYFSINKYLALIGFSYIRKRTSDGLDIPSDNPTDNPISYDQDGKYPYGLESVWAINISFMNSNIQTVKTGPSERAKLIFNEINRNLNNLSDELDLESKGLFFKNTVNLVKVHQMGQIIESYMKTAKDLRDSLEKRDKKIEAMGQKIEEMEQEKEAMEQEKEEWKQKYQNLLLKHGIKEEDE